MALSGPLGRGAGLGACLGGPYLKVAPNGEPSETASDLGDVAVEQTSELLLGDVRGAGMSSSRSLSDDDGEDGLTDTSSVAREMDDLVTSNALEEFTCCRNGDIRGDNCLGCDSSEESSPIAGGKEIMPERVLVGSLLLGEDSSMPCVSISKCYTTRFETVACMLR